MLLRWSRAQVSIVLSPRSLGPDALQNPARPVPGRFGCPPASRSRRTCRWQLAAHRLPSAHRHIHILDHAGKEARRLGPLPQPAMQLAWAGADGDTLIAATPSALHLWAAAGEHEGPVLQAPQDAQFAQLAACRASPLLAASTTAGEVGAACSWGVLGRGTCTAFGFCPDGQLASTCTAFVACMRLISKIMGNPWKTHRLVVFLLAASLTPAGALLGHWRPFERWRSRAAAATGV